MNAKTQISVLRRQNTFLEKRVRRLERERIAYKSGLRVIKWAKRYVEWGTAWDKIQLRRAVWKL